MKAPRPLQSPIAQTLSAVGAGWSSTLIASRAGRSRCRRLQARIVGVGPAAIASSAWLPRISGAPSLQSTPIAMSSPCGRNFACTPPSARKGDAFLGQNVVDRLRHVLVLAAAVRRGPSR